MFSLFAVVSMVPHTRRRFLHTATALAGGFAGCSRLSSDAEQPSQTPTESTTSNSSTSNTETDPPTVLLRAGSEIPPIRVMDPDQETTRAPRPERFSPRMTHELVDSQSKGQQLTVAGDEDSDTVSSFIAETDFDNETVYLETNEVKECFRLKLCHISWHPSKIETDYTQQLRPYDESCTVEKHVFESRLIRLPVALDGDSVNSFGSRISGSGRCNPTSGPRAEGSSRSESASTTLQATDGGEH